jgi:CRISPR-associated protein (TIGR03986 family)
VEILGDAPLHPINADRFAYRTLGASGGGENFEPCHQFWNDTILAGQGGYLKPGDKEGNGWSIIPAAMFPGYGLSFCKVRRAIGEAFNVDFSIPPDEVWFPSPMPVPGAQDGLPVADQCQGVVGAAPYGLPNRGWRLKSGEINRKQHQWIINAPGPATAALRIPPRDVLHHIEAGLTKWVDLWRDRCPNGIPCFYSQNGGSVFFGPTRNFKLPYATTICEANRARRTAVEPWDLAQMIFGRLENKSQDKSQGRSQDGARTRVFFEDAILKSGDVSHTQRIHAIFGSPKPTTFQHYLDQPQWSAAQSIPWGTNAARLRGTKMYWRRRQKIPIQDQPGARPELLSVFDAVQVDPQSPPVFEARIRFENLDMKELGVLLCALRLQDGKRHQLGLAKPYGYGVFHIHKLEALRINHEQRFGSFFQSGQELPALASGLQPLRVLVLENAFAQLRHNKPTVAAMWEMPRFKELAALLEWDGLPNGANADRWNQMTRYLAFGKLPYQHTTFQYNEYLRRGHGEAGFPFPDHHNVPRPPYARRRPLPSATQVLSDAQPHGNEPPNFTLPRDPRPPYPDD